MAELEKESIFRQFATSINVSSSNNTVLAYASDDEAARVPEGESINVSDLADDFTRIKTEAHKVVSLVKVANAFVTDNAFDIKKHLPKRFAKVFGRAEENLFINGTGEGQPVGILNDTLGAETGVTTTDVTFDDVISLYMSVKAKHRKHGVWLMNDETALALRKLKDRDSNYLWQEGMDTILGKSVYISEFMPSIATGKKVIAFGDFSYYWILNRRPLAVRALKEKFELYDQTGYLAMEYIDGKFVSREAIKVAKWLWRRWKKTKEDGDYTLFINKMREVHNLCCIVRADPYNSNGAKWELQAAEWELYDFFFWGNYFQKSIDTVSKWFDERRFSINYDLLKEGKQNYNENP